MVSLESWNYWLDSIIKFFMASMDSIIVEISCLTDVISCCDANSAMLEDLGVFSLLSFVRAVSLLVRPLSTSDEESCLGGDLRKPDCVGRGMFASFPSLFGGWTL